MQVDVDNGAVLILPGWKNHLERTEAEGLRQKPTHMLLQRGIITQKEEI